MDTEINVKPRRSAADIILKIVCIVLIVVLIPILAFNLVLMVNSFINPGSLPNIAGYYPVAVTTDSLSPDVSYGDLMMCQKVDSSEIVTGDIVAFYITSKEGRVLSAGKVENVLSNDDGKLAMIVSGKQTNDNVISAVAPSDLIGRMSSTVPNLGNIVTFLQSGAMRILCLILMVLFVILTMIRRRISRGRDKTEYAELIMDRLENIAGDNIRERGFRIRHGGSDELDELDEYLKSLSDNRKEKK